MWLKKRVQYSFIRMEQNVELRGELVKSFRVLEACNLVTAITSSSCNIVSARKHVTQGLARSKIAALPEQNTACLLRAVLQSCQSRYGLTYVTVLWYRNSSVNDTPVSDSIRVASALLAVAAVQIENIPEYFFRLFCLTFVFSRLVRRR
jgi:hypothetical protein